MAKTKTVVFTSVGEEAAAVGRTPPSETRSFLWVPSASLEPTGCLARLAARLGDDPPLSPPLTGYGILCVVPLLDGFFLTAAAVYRW